MLIDPKHLIQIAEIVDCGSFTEAAHRLNSSQPALSRVALELEKRLGTPLFSSRRNPVIPTAIGRQLADQGRTIKLSTNVVSHLLDLHLTGQKDELKIGTPPFFADEIVSGFIAKRIASYPNVRIILEMDYMRGLQDKLVDGKLDLILGALGVVEGAPNLQIDPLIKDHLVIICRINHPLLSEPNLNAEKLSNAKWISYLGRDNVHANIRQFLSDIGLKQMDLPSFETTSTAAIRAVLAETDLLIVMPRLVAAKLVESKNFAVLPNMLARRKSFQSIGIITHKLRQTAALKEFALALRAELICLGDVADKFYESVHHENRNR